MASGLRDSLASGRNGTSDVIPSDGSTHQGRIPARQAEIPAINQDAPSCSRLGVLHRKRFSMRGIKSRRRLSSGAARARKTYFRPTRTALASLVAGACLIACGEHALTGPSEGRIAPQAPSRLVGGSSTFTIPVAPFSDFQTVPRMSTGIIVPKLATYVMRVSGVVTASPNGDNPCGADDLPTLTFGEGFDTDWLAPTIDSWTPSPTRWVSDTIPPGAEHEIFVSRGGYGAAVGCNAPDGSRIGGPLYVLSSSQTLAVDIIKIGTFKLAVRPQLANPVPRDTTVVFIPWNDGDTQDDFRTDSWKWTPADGSPAVDLWPNDCGIVCRRQLTSSGTMTLSGTVGGFRDGHRERVSASSDVVVGGNPKIQLALSQDTVPLGQIVTVTTTITGATDATILGYEYKSVPIVASRMGAFGTLKSRQTRSGQAGLAPPAAPLRTINGVSTPPCLGTTPAPATCYVVAEQSGTITVNAQAAGKPISDSKTLTVIRPSVTCEPTKADRGAELVTCTPKGFAVVGKWTFTPDAGAGDLDPVEEIYNRAGSEPWVGLLVVNGTVKVSGWTTVAAFPTGAQEETDPVHLSVRPRSWGESKLQLTDLPKVNGHGDLPDEPIKDGTGYSMRYGQLKLEGVKPYSMGAPTSGPNKNYFFLLKEPQLKQPIINLNRALDGKGAWAKSQTGKVGNVTVDPVSRLPFCTTSAFGKLKPFVEAHEGVNGEPTSHYGLWQKTFANSDLLAKWEGLAARDKQSLEKLASKQYDALVTSDEANAPQAQHDSTDDPKIPTWSGGCVFHN